MTDKQAADILREIRPLLIAVSAHPRKLIALMHAIDKLDPEEKEEGPPFFELKTSEMPFDFDSFEKGEEK